MANVVGGDTKRLEPLEEVARSKSNDEPDSDEEELEEASVGKLLLTNLSENLADAASQASSTLSGFIDKQKNMVKKSRGFARKVVAELKQDTRSSTSESAMSPAANEHQSPKKRSGFFAAPKTLFGFSQTTTRKVSDTVEGSISSLSHTDMDQSIKDQEFLRSIVQLVKEGREASYSIGSRLRDLLTDENYRSYLISKIHVGRSELVGDPECTLTDYVNNAHETQGDTKPDEENIIGSLSKSIKCLKRDYTFVTAR
ncbi:unnamed protein product [Echinostoma caproni]|uniref:RGS domain-containing protein n=1 Tax=Echinostoma caproni TaxID=27848 RepID=A0A183ABN9_9TREM|nr:unnamed protein product [Echinostoma caproni]